MSSLKYNIALKSRERELRKSMTPAEKIVWYKLLSKDKLNGYRFLRQKPVGIFILDFYCSKLLLGLEIDGKSHLDKLEYDNERTIFLAKQRISIIRYTNDDILNNLNSVHIDLLQRIEKREIEILNNINEYELISPLSKGVAHSAGGFKHV